MRNWLKTFMSPLLRLVMVFPLVILFSGHLWGLDPATPIDGYLKSEWRVKNGFVSDAIFHISQFDDGYLWVGSDAGAIRLDGHRLKKVSFEAENPGWGTIAHCFYKDSAGTWLGTSQGLFRYSRGRLNRMPEGKGLPTRNMVRFLEKDCYGNLWASVYNKGLFFIKDGKLERDNVRKVLDVDTPRRFMEDRAGNLWISASSRGLFKGGADGFQKIDLHFKEKKSTAPYVSIYHALEDRKGRIWIGTTRGVILMPNGNTSEQINYDTRDGLAHDTVWTMLEDSGGCIWFGTYAGLNRLKEDADGRVGFEKTLDKKRVLYLFEDREKNLWVATFGDGLLRLQDTVFDVYYREKNVPVGPNLLYRDAGGNIWLGSSLGGLYKMENGRFIKKISLGNMWGAQVSGITADRQGNLWISTMTAGLFYYDVKRNHAARAAFYDDFQARDIPVIYMDREDNLWVGTDKGVLCKSGGTVRAFTVENGTLAKSFVLDITRDREGNTWIGTTGGLHFFKGEPEPGKAEVYFGGMGITSIYEDKDGTIWVGTEFKGLRRLKEGKWSEFRVKDGLVFGDILQIKEDKKNHFWTTSEHGIMRVDKNELVRFARGESKRITSTSFGFSDGLNTLSCCMNPKNAIIENRDGKFWFSTHHGIAVVRPEDVTIDKQPPPVIIEEARFNGQWVSVKNKKAVFQGEGRLQLSFTAPVFRSPEKVKFKYRLEGCEDRWHTLDAFGERTVHYENLTFGKYAFRVIASNASGVWNLRGAKFEFQLKPYYYQTIFFKVSMLLVIVLSLAAGFLGMKRYLYIRKLKQKYKNSTLDPQKAETYLKKILHFLKVEKIYRDEELSLAGFAEKLAIAPRYLSQIVNERMNKNFRDFINGYRIEEAKAFLSGKKKSGHSVLEIAFEVGFNSKEAFNRAFKRYTGKTPTEFKKENNGHS